MNTPTLDKYRLHPFGGYAKDYKNGEFEKLVIEQRERWNTLTPEENKIAREEYDYAYPKTSNQDGR